MATEHKVLILGGTADSRKLADLCVSELGSEIDVISSLAGRTKTARTLAGRVRVGGFGGEQGLRDYLATENISALVDATHPFAATISQHAARAAEMADVPRIMVSRPAWRVPGGLTINRVADLQEAADVLAQAGPRSALVTTGIKGLGVFANLPDTHFVIRQIEDHEGPPPFPNAEIIVQQPPFTVAQERQTMTDHAIEALVTKDSGGSATEAKLIAAQALDVPVIMISRPPLPEGETVSSPDDALVWIKSVLET